MHPFTAIFLLLDYLVKFILGEIERRCSRVKSGGFLGPIGHFEGRRAVISVTNSVELDERNPPLQEPNGHSRFDG